MGGIKKTGRKGRWSSGKWHRKEIKEWAGAKLWARKRDTGCPDKICVITESSLIVETVNSITKWCKSGKTRVSQQFHLKKKTRKKPPTTNQNNSGRYLQPIFGGAGKGKELPRSQILRLTTGLPSAIAVEFTLPAYLLPLQVPYLVLALLLERADITGLWTKNIFALCFLLQEEQILGSDPSGWWSKLLAKPTGDILVKGGKTVCSHWESGKKKENWKTGPANGKKGARPCLWARCIIRNHTDFNCHLPGILSLFYLFR